MMKLTWFGSKAVHNYSLCLFGIGCVSHFGLEYGTLCALVPAFILGIARNTESARNYWFHGNKESNK